MTVEGTAPNERSLSHGRFMPLVVWGSVALGIVALLLTGEARRMLVAFANADWWLVAPLLIVAMILPVVHARRWQVMLRSVGHDLPLDSAVELTISSTMINYAAPGYLWSPAKGLMARQMFGIGLGRSVPTLAAEQSLDALALMLGTIAGLVLVGSSISRSLVDRLSGPSVGLAVALLALAVCGCLALLYLLKRFGRQFTGSLLEAGAMLARDGSLRFPVVGLTIARWLLDTAAIWFAAKAFGLTLGFAPLLLISSLPLLIGLISPMPGGIGFREGAMAGVAGVLVLSTSAILAAAILHRAILLAALPLVLGIIRVRRWARA